MVVGATPMFWPLMRHGAGSGYSCLYSYLSSPPGGRSHHRDPFGKGKMEVWSQVVPVNLALTAVGLRVWLDPWPALGEVSLLDLVRATHPLD